MSSADDLNRFFPIVPQNAPPDDLSSYLDMYAHEAGAYYRSQTSGAPPNGYEKFVNPPFPRMRTLRGLGLASFGIVGQPTGRDPTSLADSNGNPIVSAVWLQRALNAAGVGPLQVDGVAGPATLTAALAFWRMNGSAGTAPTVQVVGTSVDHPGHVKITSGMENILSAVGQVADPAPPPRQTPAQPPVTDSIFVPPAAVSSSGGLLVGAVIALGLLVTFNPKNAPKSTSRRGR